MGIGQFQLNLNFGSFPVLLHDHTPSRVIRHEKIHGIRYPERQNRTIFRDSRISYLIEVKSDNRDKLQSAIFRFEALKSLKMVRF